MPKNNSGSTRRQIIALSIVGIISRAIDFSLPIVLVRFLVIDDFAGYKLLWLIIGTVALIAPMGMPGSLLYFIPRSEDKEKLAYINQTILFVAGAALLFSVLLLTFNIKGLPEYNSLIAAFVFLWVTSSFIDILPNADERYGWHIGIIISTTLVRLVLVLTAAIVSRDLYWVVIAMIIFASLKLIMGLFYVKHIHHNLFSKVKAINIKRQLRYAAPFGLSGGAYRLKELGEQWVVAFLFAPAMFAVFSVAASIIPLISLIRAPIKNVLLPKMSRAEKNSDVKNALSMNASGNLAVSFILFPLLVCLMVYADEIVTILFTSAYADAASVLRVYVIALFQQGIEVATVMVILRLGGFSLKVNLLMLILALITSYAGANLFGIVGAAFGSTLAMYCVFALNLIKVSRETGISVRKLQDWKGLGNIFIISMLSGLIVWYTNTIFLDHASPAFKVFLGSSLCILIYISLLSMTQYRWILIALLGKGQWRKAEI